MSKLGLVFEGQTHRKVGTQSFRAKDPTGSMPAGLPAREHVESEPPLDSRSRAVNVV